MCAGTAEMLALKAEGFVARDPLNDLDGLRERGLPLPRRQKRQAERGSDTAELMRRDTEARRANSVESPHLRIRKERVVRRLCQRAVAIADTQVGELPHDLQPL